MPGAVGVGDLPGAAAFLTHPRDTAAEGEDADGGRKSREVDVNEDAAEGKDENKDEDEDEIEFISPFTYFIYFIFLSYLRYCLFQKSIFFIIFHLHKIFPFPFPFFFLFFFFFIIYAFSTFLAAMK